MRGQIYFIRGNIRIQVVTDSIIYFYKIVKTFEENSKEEKYYWRPELENSMNNDMNCSMMMFGKAVRYGITYKSSEPGFRIYTRKQFHNFKVTIDAQNYEGSHGVNLTSKGQYVIARKNVFTVFNSETFE